MAAADEFGAPVSRVMGESLALCWEVERLYAIERTVFRVAHLFLKDRVSLIQSTGGKDGNPCTIVIRQPTCETHQYSSGVTKRVWTS
jgi:hypothetical protein